MKTHKLVKIGIVVFIGSFILFWLFGCFIAWDITWALHEENMFGRFGVVILSVFATIGGVASQLDL